MSVIFHTPPTQDPQPQMSRPETRALARLEAYWASLAGPSGRPLWTDFDPAAVSDVLGYSFLAHCDAWCDLHLRAAGIALARLAGKPCTGQPLSCLFDTRDHTALRHAVQASSAVPQPVEMTLTLTPNTTPEQPCAVMRLYPLCDQNGHALHFLGGVAVHSHALLPLRRFRIVRSSVRQTKVHRAPLRVVVDNT